MAEKLLILTFLCHVLDDFVLQPICLSKLKQKSWWVDQCKTKEQLEKYGNDYIVGLLIHGFSWSGTILLPYLFLVPAPEGNFLVGLFVGNGLLHALIDHLKANLHWLNLVEDQFIHLLQILLTWAILMP